MKTRPTKDPTLGSRGSGGAGETTVGDHPSLAVVIRAGEALANGLPTSHEDVFAEDFVFHYYNRRLPDLEGDYQGIGGLRGFFERLGVVSGGTFHFEPRSLTPFGDELAVAHVVDRLSASGADLELDALMVWRVVGGQIREAWDIPAVNTVRPLREVDGSPTP